MKCELLISNHANLVGIEDYIKVIKKIFIKNNILFNVVNTVSEEADLLLLIEEFVTPPRDWEGFMDRKGKDILWETSVMNIPELETVIKAKGLEA